MASTEDIFSVHATMPQPFSAMQIIILNVRIALFAMPISSIAVHGMPSIRFVACIVNKPMRAHAVLLLILLFAGCVLILKQKYQITSD